VEWMMETVESRAAMPCIVALLSYLSSLCLSPLCSCLSLPLFSLLALLVFLLLLPFFLLSLVFSSDASLWNLI